MSIFMSKTDKNLVDKKLVGVHIIKNDAHRLAMLSLENSRPRTAILLEIINEYLREQPSLSEMIEKAVNQAAHAWKRESKSEPTLTEKIFCDQIRKDLVTHRIEDEVITRIIKGVTNKI